MTFETTDALSMIAPMIIRGRVRTRRNSGRSFGQTVIRQLVNYNLENNEICESLCPSYRG